MLAEKGLEHDSLIEAGSHARRPDAERSTSSGTWPSRSCRPSRGYVSPSLGMSKASIADRLGLDEKV